MALRNAFKAYLTVEKEGAVVTLSNGTKLERLPFDKLTGGKATVGEVKYTPAEGIQRTYTGIKTFENVTLESSYKQSVHGALLPGQSGDKTDIRGLGAKVIVEDLIPGTEKYAQNRPPYEGLILEVTPPEYDSNDASQVAMIGVVVSVGSLAL